MPRIAETVVADANAGDNAFMVDGERFPWWISEDGPAARKLADDLYLVHVTIYSVIDYGSALVHGALPGPDGGYWAQPILDGVEFPWWISDAGFTYRSSGRDLPSLELEFFTKSVEGVPVTAEQYDGKVRESGGNVVAIVNSAC